MLLIILGLIIFGVTGIVVKNNVALHRFRNIGRLIGVLLIVLGIIFSSIVQINAGEIGIKVLFGSVKKDVLQSGLHFVNPLYEIKKVDVKTQNYTMSGVNDEGGKAGDDAIRVLTSDGLEVTIDLTVLYRVGAIDAPKLYQQTGLDYKDKIVRPITRTKIRDNAVYYQAIELFSL